MIDAAADVPHSGWKHGLDIRLPKRTSRYGQGINFDGWDQGGSQQAKPCECLAPVPLMMSQKGGDFNHLYMGVKWSQ